MMRKNERRYGVDQERSIDKSLAESLMNRFEQEKVLKAFRKTLLQELHNLKEHPELLWQQIFNRLQWVDKEKEGGAIKKIIEPEFRKRKTNSLKPWAHNIIRTRESEAILMTFIGHTSSVESVNFSPDGKKIVSASVDRTIKLWNAETGEEIKTLKGHKNLILSVNFSPDGKKIVSGSADRTIKLWNAETGEGLKTLTGHTDWVNSVTFSPDGKTIVSASSDKTIKLWNAETGEEPKTLKGHTRRVNSVTFSPDGKTIASASRDETIKLWNAQIKDEPKTLTGHTHEVNSVTFSPDGKKIISASSDKTVKLWDEEKGKELEIPTGHTHEVKSIAFSSDGKKIASASRDKTIKLWNAETGEEIKTLKKHTHWVESVAFSPDGKKIVSGSRDKTIKLWDIEKRDEPKIFTAHTHEVYSVAFSPDGKTIVSGSYDKNLKLWNVETGGKIRSFKGHKNSVKSVAFSPDGKIIVSGSADRTIKLWYKGTEDEPKTLKGHTDRVCSVAFSPDGKTIVSASWDKTIKLWNADKGKEIKTLIGHTHEVCSVAFSPDGKTIVSASLDRTLKLWNAETGECLFDFPALGFVNCSAFSPLSSSVCCGDSGGTIYILELYGFDSIFDQKKEEIPEDKEFLKELKLTRAHLRKDSIEDILFQLKKIANEEEMTFFLFLEKKITEGRLNEIKPNYISELIMGTNTKPTAVSFLFEILSRNPEDFNRLKAGVILFSEAKKSLFKFKSKDLDILSECLKTGLVSDSYTIRNACMWAIFKIKGADAFNIYFHVFSHQNPEVRFEIARLFGFLRDKRAVPILIKALRIEPFPNIRSTILWALGYIKDPRALQVLIEHLNDEDPEVGGYAAWALGEIEGLRAWLALANAVTDLTKDKEVKDWAKRALYKIKFGKLIKTKEVKQKKISMEKQTITCKCGHKNSQDKRWCEKCGREL